MSHSSPSYYPAADHIARHVQPRAQSAGSISRHLHRSHDGYTLTHAGHQVRIGPVAFWIVVGTLVIMAVWSIATGTYFAFRDNVLTRLIGRQAGSMAKPGREPERSLLGVNEHRKRRPGLASGPDRRPSVNRKKTRA